MRDWKHVSGILSVIFSALIFLRACDLALDDALSEVAAISGGGMIVAVITFAGGVVSLFIKNGFGKGGNIALIIFHGLAALFGFAFSMYGYPALKIFSFWNLICLLLAFLCMPGLSTKRTQHSSFVPLQPPAFPAPCTPPAPPAPSEPSAPYAPPAPPSPYAPFTPYDPSAEPAETSSHQQYKEPLFSKWLPYIPGLSAGLTLLNLLRR